MKALTICQPYAELIVRGAKWVENRTWHTEYRGYLAIHAGKSRAYMAEGDDEKYPDMVFGEIIGIATLHVCIERVSIPSWGYYRICRNPYTEGPQCWILTDVRRLLRPLTYRGQRGLFDLPADIAHGLLHRKYVIEPGGLRTKRVGGYRILNTPLPDPQEAP